ncbi:MULTISPECIES: divisome protein SepX/GlpR [Pseudonocardia]|uniref:Uncharacterized protein n=2 Tax=Pseudonocardia TaxID=1847 RepID=A0A1Y2MK66_PSEAH|nr:MULTISPECIES: gephyrin-like molybdotransferase receptor GlpR [Pseudonocardia]OSY35655.1 hypothetical protein BG845_05865 [Pseudonocardia autotrophica]TDN75735.1 hypothetical protein C8E95_4917 [Pseudonocardia autotrophica]BBF99704.1 hypothetical protein Pdca_09140 [Pseudonocardia autotrophica]GEC27205.1 hypothetical protein PSA01_42340 [Pseudonocardia saturnea]
MPSSLIFVGLVVLWLLILVPTVARRQQEVARLSPALLSGRVLERPMRHRYPEVLVMERSGPSTVGELVQSRDGVPGPRTDGYDDAHGGDHDRGDREHGDYGRGDYDRGDYGRGDHDYDDGLDAEIDDDGRVHGLEDDHLDAEHAEHDGYDEYAEYTDGAERDDAERDGGRAADRERDPRTAEPAAVGDGDEPGDADPADDRFAADRFGDDRLVDDRFTDDDAETDRDEMLEPDATGIGYPDDEDANHAPSRYRPGRGGFDPEAAAAAAHAKYTFRQRVVLALLVLLVVAGVTALLVSTVFWWVAGVLGAGLVGYLTYLRRQVRIEEAIRARRAARLAAPRRATADEPEPQAPGQIDDPDTEAVTADAERPDNGDDDVDWTADDGEPTRVRGTGQPLGVLPARRRTVEGPASTEHESSLPRLVAAPPPPVPDGTSLVDVDAEEEPDVLDDPTLHRRAAGE